MCNFWSTVASRRLVSRRIRKACTAVSKWPADDNSFVTAGEDGRANVVRIGEDSPWWSSSGSGSLGGQSRPSINGVAAYAGLVWTVNSGKHVVQRGLGSYSAPPHSLPPLLPRCRSRVYVHLDIGGLDFIYVFF